MNESSPERLVRWARSLFNRGLTSGSSGNISIRDDQGYWITPTNSCLGFLEPERVSRLDPHGQHIAGEPPSKEAPLHLAFYKVRAQARAVVHLHSTYATAMSCRADLDPTDTIPALTPYVVMRAGRVPLVPYGRPGSADIASAVERLAVSSTAVLLANHGPVVSGTSLENAIFALEEIEEAARLSLITRGLLIRTLTGAEIRDLQLAFPTS